MNINDFDYFLPQENIAQAPLDRRDMSKLMILDRETKKIYHKTFTELPNYLRKDDLMVFNNSKVFPAKLFLEKTDTKKAFEGLVLEIIDNNSLLMLIKNSKKLDYGSKLSIIGSKTVLELINKDEKGQCTFIFEDHDILKTIERVGNIPLPHYIKREDQSKKDFDKKRYQTIYAKNTGSIAAPTAGLHFNEKMLSEVSKKGVKTANVTLHVGYATFKPIRTDNILDHKMDFEKFSVKHEDIQLINNAKRNNTRVIAVGTTTVRTLESVFAYDKPLSETKDTTGKTDKFIYPGYKFHTVNTLLTNFHLPKSTLLMLVCAFGGQDFIISAYNEAVKNDYRFFSYGDAMLIL